MTLQVPDFDSIKQINPYGAEYWSARDLAPLLGYSQWRRFEDAIKRAKISCETNGTSAADHFSSVGKMVGIGSESQREVKDYLLSRFACYAIAQNGDPRKPEIAAAQAYFIISTRENELAHLLAEQEKRLHLREQVTEHNKMLAQAASEAGVLSRSFGTAISNSNPSTRADIIEHSRVCSSYVSHASKAVPTQGARNSVDKYMET